MLEHPGVMIQLLPGGMMMAASTVLIQLNENDTAVLKLKVDEQTIDFGVIVGGPTLDPDKPQTYQCHVCHKLDLVLMPLVHCELEIKEAPPREEVV